MSHKISRIFKVNINIAGAASRYNKVEESSTSLKVLRTAREEQPWYGAYNADGSYKVNGTEIVRHNPVMLVNEEKWTLDKYHLSGIFSIDITPFKGFKWTPACKPVHHSGQYDQKTDRASRRPQRINAAGEP